MYLVSPMSNTSSDTDAHQRPLRGLAVAGQLHRWASCSAADKRGIMNSFLPRSLWSFQY
jgi:hypothetical protein